MPSGNENGNWGLKAIGKAGQITIELGESSPPAEEAWATSAAEAAGVVGERIQEHSAVPGLRSAEATVAWELSVEVLSMSFRFRIPSEGTVSGIADFFRSNYGSTSIREAKADDPTGLPVGTRIYSMVDEMEFGIPGGGQVRIVKDGELPDRFIISMSGSGHQMTLDMHDPWVKDLIAAFDDLVEDMKGNEQEVSCVGEES
jgi:hypothetical protein